MKTIVRSVSAAALATGVGMAVAEAQYVPPVGIPAPSFGINELHTRYAGQTFAPGGFPYRDAGNGPYSHYVDRSSGGCTDSDNAYGTAGRPRCSVPVTLPAGSVVEIHGTDYAAAGGPDSDPAREASLDRNRKRPRRRALTLTGTGTASEPVIIRGFSAAAKPRFNLDVRIHGTYVVVENIEVTSGRVFLDGDNTVLRNSHVHHGDVPGALVLARANSTVVYHNEINNITGGDRHGVSPAGGISNVWILENKIYECEGDAIQFCHGCIRTGASPANVYIGRNKMYSATTGENAIDIKETIGPVIISENEMWGYQDTRTSNGEAIRINDEGRQGEIWIVNNRIHDSLHGIQPQRNHSTGVYILGNLFYNLTGSAIRTDGGFVYNNTIYDVGGAAVESATEFRNNVVVNAGASVGRRVARCSHNLVNRAGGGGGCTNTTSVNPLFLNAAGGDFRLKAGSPARNAGTDPPPYATFQSRFGRSIAFDLTGSPRPREGAWDQGAFELDLTGPTAR